MKKKLVLSALVSAALSAAAAGPASAAHSWGSYHWAEGNKSSPAVSVDLGDNLTNSRSTDWLAIFKGDSPTGANVVYNWSRLDLFPLGTGNVFADILETPAVTGANLTSQKRCTPKSGRVEVCNARYGYNRWLGLAQIWTSGGHIGQGTAKVNDTYLDGPAYSTVNKQQVLCQEVGHTFGLGHQDTSRNSTFNSCMTYDNPNADNDQWPNSHDYKQLESIYNADAATGGHVDSSNTFSNTSAASKLPAAARAVDPADPSQRGRLIDRSSNGRVEIYERDFGKGNKVITRVIRVDESTPAPEGSGPGKSPQDDGHTHDDGAAH